jgi:hypothetical protein
MATTRAAIAAKADHEEQRSGGSRSPFSSSQLRSPRASAAFVFLYSAALSFWNHIHDRVLSRFGTLRGEASERALVGRISFGHVRACCNEEQGAKLSFLLLHVAEGSQG